MKSLPRVLGLTVLALTLINCSGKLSPEKIASRLEPSIVKLFYKNQPGHGTGFFVSGEKGVCSVLTAAHVVKREGERLLQTRDEKIWQVARVQIFPSDIDLALVTFQAERGSCNYPALKIGNSESLKKGSSIYISGFPIRGGKLVSQFVSGDVSGLDKLARGYGVAYQALTVGGMSGAPVVDVKGEVVAVHGMSDREVVKSFASLQGSFSEEQRQTFQQAEKRVETGVQRLIFSWGVPINMNEIPLVSAKGVHYTKLRNLLAEKKWTEADFETYEVMVKVAGRESEGWLRAEDVDNFSCQDLGTIDKLWVEYSSGKFGFSVQKQIYQSLADTKEANQQLWIAFADQVGWRKGGKWLNWWEQGFHNRGPYARGYFPSLTPGDERGGRTGIGVYYIFIPNSSIVKTCKL
ncbi:GUN4 domain-containing protein [Dapis sp. BLCC M126]|uniref:GUN4 domain-containing protein n=1 Tax=Dapis sp. BLCC M126 TaxID=3400189 RepID=UPI003CE6C933